MKYNRAVTVEIDQSLCSGCGLCVHVCPKDVLSIRDGKAVVVGEESLNCGHCAAACPEGAINVSALDPFVSNFTTFSTLDTWLPHGEADVGSLVHIMRSRRSCRNFSEKPVKKDLLEDLVRIGVTAPSGSNCQLWVFSILADRKSVIALAEEIAVFFRAINQKAKKPWLRTFLKLIGKPELQFYYLNYMERVERALAGWKEGEKDPLFHGAPAAIIVGAKNHAVCPSEDALLATQNILLGAHALGLGTCLIGYAIKAMHRMPQISRRFKMEPDETPYAVIAVGYPRESYTRVAGRKAAEIRWL